jgi:hypothetical protein
VITLDGVVPKLDTFNDMPGMLLAFDAAAWLQQQRGCLQQHPRQPLQHVRGTDATTVYGMSSKGTRPAAEPSVQPHPQPAAVAGGNTNSQPPTRYVSTSSASRGPTPVTNSPSPSGPSPTGSPSCDVSLSAEPSQQFAAAATSPTTAAAGGGVPRYCVSYQAVGSSFFWALPLHQLGLAFSGSDGPRLLDNFQAEVVAAAAGGVCASPTAAAAQWASASSQ